MRLSFADTGLAALDALSDADSACLYVPNDERPLRGIAGYIDWRLCGGLSRILMEGRFVGAMGDALLFPARGRVGLERIFCFGSGPRAELSPSLFASLAQKSCQALALAGANVFVTELPAVAGIDDTERAKIFISEGLARFAGERVVVMGEGRALSKAFLQAAERNRSIEVDREPWGVVNVVPPPRATITRTAVTKPMKGRLS